MAAHESTRLTGARNQPSHAPAHRLPRAVAAAALLFGLAALVLFATPAAADTEMVERPTPFEIPKTFPYPHAYLADGAPGTNGTAHLVVTGLGGAYYIWVNVADGSVLESVNLTEKGFNIHIYDYYYYYYSSNSPDYDFKFVIVESFGSRVMISHAFSFAGLDTMIFDEGQAENATVTRQIFPATDPGPSLESWTFGDLTLMPNGLDPSHPSIAWARNAYSSTSYPYYDYYGTLEIGRVDIDLINGTAGSPYQVALLPNTTLNSPYQSYNQIDYPDDWRIFYESNSLAGAIDASGTPSIFALTLRWVCSPYYSYSCYYSRVDVNWTLVRADGSAQALMNVTPYAYSYYYSSYYGIWSFLDAIAAPDGSVAGFLTIPGNSSIIVYGARVGGGTVDTATFGLGGYPPTGAEAFIDGGGVKLLVGDIVNATPMAGGRLREVTGWPGPLSSGRSWTPTHPMERIAAVGSAGSLQFVGGGLLGETRTYLRANTSVFYNLSFTRSWPTLTMLGAGGVAAVDMATWEDATVAPVTGSSIVTLPNGAQAGVVTTMENGSGAARILYASGSPPAFSISAPLAVQASVYSARVILERGVAVAVIQVVYYYSSSSYGYGMVDYLMFTIASDGTTTAPVSVYDAARVSYDNSYPIDWRLMNAQPRPVLWTSLGIFLIDPWNSTATFRIAMTDSGYYYAYNSTKLYNSYNESIIPSPAWWYYGCSYSTVTGVCGFPVTAWTEGDDVLIAYVVGNYTGGYQYAYVSTPVLRVARWFPNDTVVKRDTSLWAGRPDDILIEQTTGELRHRRTSSGNVEVYLMFRQLDMWERLYRFEFAAGTGSLVSSALVRQERQRSMGGMTDGMVGFQAGVSVLIVRDPVYSPYYGGYTEVVGAYTADGSKQDDYNLPINNVTCAYYYSYYYSYYPYSYYYYYGCGRWSAIDWDGALGLLLYDQQRVRFFAPNHAPTAPRLLTPDDGTRLGRLSVTMRSTTSTDVDRDPLTYRFKVTDGQGRIVVDQNLSDPALDWKLPDGNYTWTVSVTDGFVIVQSPDTFHFDIDGSPPLADAGGPYFVRPGEGVTLNGSLSYDAGGIRRYLWTVGGVGGLEIESTEPTFPLTWEQIAGFFDHAALVAVTLRVEDIWGLEASDTSLIAIQLDAIQLDIVVLTPDAVEGSEVELAVNASWGNLRYSWTDPAAAVQHLTIVWDFPDGTHATGLRIRFTPLDSGIQVVNVTAVSGAGASGFVQANVSVRNLPPNAEGEGPRQFAEGEYGNFTITASDPSVIDNLTLRVEWTVEGGVKIVEQGAFTARLLGVANGQARLTARVLDKDGGETTVTFTILVAVASDPVAGAWIAGMGSTWADLRWTPTGETDFVRYEILVRSSTGKLLQTIDAGAGQKWLDRLHLTGLEPSTQYTFDVVVVAIGEVRSPPVSATGTTAPPYVAPEPPVVPPDPLQPSGPPPPSPEGPRNIAQISTASGGMEALGLLLAGAGVVIGLLYFRTRRQRPRSD